MTCHCVVLGGGGYKRGFGGSTASKLTVIWGSIDWNFKSGVRFNTLEFVFFLIFLIFVTIWYCTYLFNTNTRITQLFYLIKEKDQFKKYNLTNSSVLIDAIYWFSTKSVARIIIGKIV